MVVALRASRRSNHFPFRESADTIPPREQSLDDAVGHGPATGRQSEGKAAAVIDVVEHDIFAQKTTLLSDLKSLKGNPGVVAASPGATHEMEGSRIPAERYEATESHAGETAEPFHPTDQH